MTEALDDKALKWVVERIYSYSRWSDYPFDLPLSFGSGTLTGNYRTRARNILLYLQNEAKVLQIIAEPEPETKDPYNGKSIFDVSAKDTPRQTYSIQLLPSFKDYAHNLLEAVNQSQTVSAEIVLDGNRLSVKIGGQLYKLHELKMESPPLKIISYLMRYPNVLLMWEKVKYEADEINYRTPPTEFVRQLGFKGRTKDLFFPTRTKTEIRFRGNVELSPDDEAKLVEKVIGAKSV